MAVHDEADRGRNEGDEELPAHLCGQAHTSYAYAGRMESWALDLGGIRRRDVAFGAGIAVPYPDLGIPDLEARAPADQASRMGGPNGGEHASSEIDYEVVSDGENFAGRSSGIRSIETTRRTSPQCG